MAKPPSNQYREFVRAKINGAIAEAKAASTLTHNGVKGTVLEILISRLFRPLLPSDVGIGTGQIIECATGRLSHQIDIILYDRGILPPALYDESTGIFPIESVLYAIEIKTKLNKAELKKAHENAKELMNFQYIPGVNANGHSLQHNHLMSVLFALGSNLKNPAQSEAKRYKKLYASRNEIPSLGAICVANKEYSYRTQTEWISPVTMEEHDEILTFIGGVTNTYKSIANSRGMQSLGSYLIRAGLASATINI